MHRQLPKHTKTKGGFANENSLLNTLKFTENAKDGIDRNLPSKYRSHGYGYFFSSSLNALDSESITWPLSYAISKLLLIASKYRY
jgi:hypothetical protein